MTYFLASVFLFLLLNLHETHNLESLSQKLGALLVPEAEGPRRPRLDDWKAGFQRRHEFVRSDADTRYSSTEGMTPTFALKDAADGKALIAGSRRRGWPPRIKKQMASCFMCNILLPNWNSSGELLYRITGVPYDTLCDDAWDSTDRSAARLRHYLRSRCFLDTSEEMFVRVHDTGNRPRRFDRGIMRFVLGNFTGGCFKRFLDVGKVYTARGCRSYLPLYSSGFASTRFQYLEWLLQKEQDACLSSPHASLTPFSRGVSLYAHYHVCVCSGRYCNQAPAASVCWPLLLLVLSIDHLK